jgi:hypothetical protein
MPPLWPDKEYSAQTDFAGQIGLAARNSYFSTQRGHDVKIAKTKDKRRADLSCSVTHLAS